MFQFKCFIFPTEIHDIIYNLYVARFWREGGQSSIAYPAVRLKRLNIVVYINSVYMFLFPFEMCEYIFVTFTVYIKYP